MIRRDPEGFIVDSTGDGGDSANRAGLSALCGHPELLEKYLKTSGVVVRHPTQSPWNNPLNFSRDQLIPFVAGLAEAAKKNPALRFQIRKIFWRHFRRGFFSQNIQRDARGSWKFPWPHRFVNDRGVREGRLFDFADPLWPNDIWHLILCGRIWPLYVLAPLGYLFLISAILSHAWFSRSNDEGQIIAEAVIAGPWFAQLYVRTKPDWRSALLRYWSERRGMPEMAQMLIQLVEEATAA